MSSASLHGRISKLERIDGDRGAPIEEEYREAEELCVRYLASISIPRIAGIPANDPTEVSRLLEAEKTGELARAREIRERYDRVKRPDLNSALQRVSKAIERLARDGESKPGSGGHRQHGRDEAADADDKPKVGSK